MRVTIHGITIARFGLADPLVSLTVNGRHAPDGETHDPNVQSSYVLIVTPAVARELGAALLNAADEA